MSEPISFADLAPWCIRFTNDNGEEAGKLSFADNGGLQFEGDADKAARIFFDNVIANNNDRMKALLALLSVAKCPNKGCRDGAVMAVEKRHRDDNGRLERIDYVPEECQFCAERKGFLE